MSDQAATTAAERASGTIMVPLDGSALAEAALPFARALLAPDGELALARVVYNPDSSTAWMLRAAVSIEELNRAFREEAEQDLAKEAERLGQGIGRVRIMVGAGDPAEEIVRLAEEEGVELVAMATHGRGALGRWTHGSVADRVARATTVPLLLVRPAEPGEDADAPDPTAPAAIRRLVVPLDGSERAEEALAVAERYAGRLRVPVLLIRVINPVTQVPSVYGAGSLPSTWEMTEEIIKLEEDDTAAYLAGAAQRLEQAGLSVERRVELGSTVGSIAAAVQPGDAIVMTSHGRGGIGRWVLGSVAEKLVREAPAPVLLVPSAGRGGDG
jgi:nucleotide-binding universal stress UspA family protein